MKVFLAVHHQQAVTHGLIGCIHWGLQQRHLKQQPVKIYKVMPPERKARVVAEVDHTGVRYIRLGQLYDVSKALKIAKPYRYPNG